MQDYERRKDYMVELSRIMFCLFLIFFRIWRIRCTLLSRDGVHCWRISTTPEAPNAAAKHQHLPPYFLPCLFTYASFHVHLLLQSHWPLPLLLSTCSVASFLFCFSSSLTTTMLQGHRMSELYRLPLLSWFHFYFYLHVSGSECHIHSGYTCFSSTYLITWVNVWCLNAKNSRYSLKLLMKCWNQFERKAARVWTCSG